MATNVEECRFERQWGGNDASIRTSMKYNRMGRGKSSKGERKRGVPGEVGIWKRKGGEGQSKGERVPTERRKEVEVTGKRKR